MTQILRLILAPLILVLWFSPAAAEKLSLRAISDYLNNLVTAETRFRQINPDGSTSSGRLVIRRPGRMRFEYDPPESTLVLASAGQVAIFDTKSNQPPEQYPLSRTPLNLILANRVDLTRARMVIGHDERDGQTVVVAQDPDQPELGRIELVFSANPIALRGWTLVDETGARTTVVLDALKTGGSYPPSTFSITFEAERRGRRN